MTNGVRRASLAAPAAGEAAGGGDKRGKQSAALRWLARKPIARIDIRVDDHREPLGELTRLFKLFWQERRPHFSTMPTRADLSGITDRRRARRPSTLSSPAIHTIIYSTLESAKEPFMKTGGDLRRGGDDFASVSRGTR